MIEQIVAYSTNHPLAVLTVAWFLLSALVLTALSRSGRKRRPSDIQRGLEESERRERRPANWGPYR